MYDMGNVITFSACTQTYRFSMDRNEKFDFQKPHKEL